ncbi:MAG: flagellar basal body rod C-terminal domain-containing protein, partial [Aeoliella sp.]
QGLVGFEQVTSQDFVLDSAAPLDAAGLAFTPVNGAFDLLIYNTNTKITETHTLRIDLNGLDDDTSLADLTQQIEAIQGVTASINSNGNFVIAADAADTQFSFARDSSGFLAAIGVNTFFTGSTASSIGVNNELSGIDNAAKFATSLNGIGTDARNAERLAEFYTRPLDANGGASLSQQYDQLINGVTQGATVANSVAEGFRVFEATLEGENQALSAVNIDEEAIRMISLQRTYQASARFIQTISELLDTLVNL